LAIAITTGTWITIGPKLSTPCEIVSLVIRLTLPDSLDKQAILSRVRGVIEDDLLVDQPVELVAGGELGMPDRVRQRLGE
jgi:hypothetical protein